MPNGTELKFQCPVVVRHGNVTVCTACIKILLMTMWSRVLSKKLIFVQLVQNFPIVVCLHKSAPLDPILSRTYPVHNLTYLFKIYFNVIPQSLQSIFEVVSALQVF